MHPRADIGAARPTTLRLTVLIVAAIMTATISAQQTPPQAARPVTLVSEVRAAINAHDIARADALVAERRTAVGNTPEVLEAASWVARGAQAEGQRDRAAALAADVHRLSVAALAGRTVDDDPRLATAIGAAIEVQALVAAERNERTEAIAFLERELARYKNTTITKRIQKNINLLTMEGDAAPAVEAPEWIGARPPAVTDLKGKVVVLFFWAHWCPDCKKQGPVLEKLLDTYGARGLAIVAPTQRYGYVAGGAKADADEELRYIAQIRDQFYPWMQRVPVPLSVANHQRYGVSTTPTMVVVDRAGTIRAYHPGQMTERELERTIVPLLE